jgi:hypothetical protein
MGVSSMEGFSNKIHGLSRFSNMIAGISLTFLMMLTVADVFLRTMVLLGRWLMEKGAINGIPLLLASGNSILEHFRPIVGTYELVAFSGAVAIGFSMPLTSWMRGHIYVDFFILKFSKKTRNGFNMVTRCLGIFLFLMVGWNLIKFGMDLQKSGEVSLTLQMPFYPIAYGMGICCFIQCLVLVCDMVKIFRGKYE